MNNLYELVNYNSNTPFIFSTHIREYDIQKANINILLEKGVIDQDQYDSLYQSDKTVRQVKIGLLLQSNPKLVDVLKDGIVEAKRKLFEANHIQQNSVLSIKNDAVFLINTTLKHTEFGRVKFVQKNDYTSYMNIFHTELFYSLNRVQGTDSITVKGIGKENLKKHEPYFLDFITYIFNIIETESSDYVITSFKNFYNQFIQRELPIGFYRNFDAISKYSLLHSPYLLENITDTTNNKADINISYNINFLRMIYQYITTLYFSKYKI